MKRIILNKIKCNYCGDIIISENCHDFKRCKCGKVAIDGGNYYLRRIYTNSQNDFTELSIVEDEK